MANSPWLCTHCCRTSSRVDHRALRDGRAAVNEVFPLLFCVVGDLDAFAHLRRDDLMKSSHVSNWDRIFGIRGNVTGCLGLGATRKRAGRPTGVGTGSSD